MKMPGYKTLANPKYPLKLVLLNYPEAETPQLSHGSDQGA